MRDYGVTPSGIDILIPKTEFYAFTLAGISSWEANIIKQHLLSLGTDSAISRNALVKKCKTNTVIFGNKKQLTALCVKLKDQPFSLPAISEKLTQQLNYLNKDQYVLSVLGRKIKVTNPIVCGIINVTPDSFSGDGLIKSKVTEKELIAVAVAQAGKMIQQGAGMLDIGGQSTRPFSDMVTAVEESKRVVPVIAAIRKKFPQIILSVDTYYCSVAQKALDAGADIVNDITALTYDKRMLSLIQKTKAGCVLMHMKGMPKNMQKNPIYKNVTNEVLDFVSDRVTVCLEKNISQDQLIIDPGIGFGKRVEDNLKLLHDLYKFKIFGLPIFVGLSNKSFIGKIIGQDVNDRTAGTVSANIMAILNGAKILRVHDVRSTIDALKLAEAICSTY
ncbi:MAG: dihydropteroate synthase [Candidatus Omnitrophica bacterium]|nr:dihydropteroate synthase [Candidatus Omnitrophota bacterium]MDD5081143.1 dihydropteroate synthase [Candidatus Omnitrophota bacterium]MDD5441678.1 dihydropteroate synthase [Candidatus Omnitrophota bacterium]